MSTVLLVEDDDNLRGMFRTALALAGYAVIEACDGLEALRRLDSHTPQLIVLDLMLPYLDGFAVLDEVATLTHTRHTPVVIVTALSCDLSAFPVACVLRKPFEPDALILAVGRFTHDVAGT